MTRLISHAEVKKMAARSEKVLEVEHGTVVTPLARETAATLGVKIVEIGSRGSSEPREAGKKCAGGARYCIQCGSCSENQTEAEAPTSTEKMLAILKAFLKSVWPEEPSDLTSLRQISLPPMGNMPCVLYASFNMFWLGESMQVWRSVAMDRGLPVDALCLVLAKDIGRHAARLAKWHVPETLKTVKALQAYFEGKVPKTYGELEDVLAAALVALDRMQNWIDAVIPWSKMDKALGGLRKVWRSGGDSKGKPVTGDLNEAVLRRVIDAVIRDVLEHVK